MRSTDRDGGSNLKETRPMLEKESNARVWVGSSAKPVSQRLQHDWWCLSSQAASGDVLVLYQAGLGIARVERVGTANWRPEQRCHNVGLRTVQTDVVLELKTPITARELKEHSALRLLPAVKRNFQGTCFGVPDELWSALRDLILEHCR